MNPSAKRGVVCRTCRRWLQIGAVRTHQCSADDAPEKRNLKSFVKHGVTWRAGVRVTTRCPLAGTDKMEYEAGASGCVWEVLCEGVVMVCLDNANCDVVLVEAEVGDVIAQPMLAPQTAVKCREILVRGTVRADRDNLNVIPQGLEAHVVNYYEERNSYAVRFPSLNVMAEVVTNEVQPAKLPKANRRIGIPSVAAAATLPASPASPASPDIAGVRNLAKKPAFSNVTGSPRAQKQRSQRRFMVTLDTGVEGGSPAGSPRGWRSTPATSPGGSSASSSPRKMSVAKAVEQLEASQTHPVRPARPNDLVYDHRTRAWVPRSSFPSPQPRQASPQGCRSEVMSGGPVPHGSSVVGFQ